MMRGERRIKREMMNEFEGTKVRARSSKAQDKFRELILHLGAALVIAMAVAVLFISKHLYDILKQPKLASKAVLLSEKDFASLEKQAMHIATENLYMGIEARRLKNDAIKQIVHAGYRNFRESWARDFGFAAYGLLSLGEKQPVKDTLEAFFWYQKPDGQFPVKLQSLNVVSRYIHSRLGREQPLKRRLVPKYVTSHRTLSFDSQAMLIEAASHYILKMDDRDFGERYWNLLRKSMEWIKIHAGSEDNLLYQQGFSDWVDSVARKGVVLYTNLVYWKALRSMVEVSLFLGEENIAKEYRELSKNLHEAINHRLWLPRSGFFSASEHIHVLSSAGNLLAIAWGFADEHQSYRILDAIQAANMADPVPTQAAFPSYKKSEISLENRLGGMANYHTNGAWLWIGAWQVIALCRLERLQNAKMILARIIRTITRDQQVHEVYGPNGLPLSGFWYTSESPLIWNAAMVIYALHVFEGYSNYYSSIG